MVISADRLRDFTEGPAETKIIGACLTSLMPLSAPLHNSNRVSSSTGNILMSNEKTAQYVIDETAWQCIWTEVIYENKGPMTFDDRDISSDPNFSQFMLVEMLGEVRRLVDKYSAAPWTNDINANRLVLLLSEHIPLLQTEIDGLASGSRTLSVKDILGPGEREALFGNTVA